MPHDGPNTKTPRRTWVGPAIRVALFAVLVYVIARSFAWEQIRHSFALMQPIYLVPVVLVLTPLAVLLRSLRWRRLVPGGTQLPVGTFVRAYLIGFLANSLLLGKMGDLVKAGEIRSVGVEYATSLSSALVDRILEGVALVMVMAVALLGAELPLWATRIAILAATGSLVALFTLRELYLRQAASLASVERWTQSVSGPRRERIVAACSQLLRGLESLGDLQRVMVALGYSLAVWAAEIGAVLAFLYAFSVPAPRLIAAVVVLAALNFGTLLPVSPGSVGVYQLLCVFALSIWNVPRDLAFSFGLMMQAALFLPVYAAGLVCLVAPRWRKRQAMDSSMAVTPSC